MIGKADIPEAQTPVQFCKGNFLGGDAHGITLARDRGYCGKRRPFTWSFARTSLPYSIINFLDRELLSTSAFTFYGTESVGLWTHRGIRTPFVET
jgi:hypothetical protein